MASTVLGGRLGLGPGRNSGKPDPKSLETPKVPEVPLGSRNEWGTGKQICAHQSPPLCYSCFSNGTTRVWQLEEAPGIKWKGRNWELTGRTSPCGPTQLCTHLTT